MAVPTAPTAFVPGNIPSATNMNTSVRDAINFFLNPPRCSVRDNRGTVTRTATGTWELLAWNVDVVDTDAIHDPVTNNSRLIAKTAGMYYVWFNIQWELHNTQAYDGERGVMIRKNSAGAVGTGTLVGIDHRASNSNPLEKWAASMQGVAAYVAMAVNDYVECFAYDNDDDTTGFPAFTPVGCYLDTTDYNAHRFGMEWVSI